MKYSLVGLLFFVLLTPLGDGAHADGNCPDGYYPIGAPEGESGPAGCAPVPNYNGQDTNTRSRSAPPEYFPQQTFGFQPGAWGAVALDAANGKIGAATLLSESAAEQAAIGECREKGGASCTIQITYHDACIALAEGDSLMLTGRTDVSLEAARRSAMNECAKSSTNCHVPYSDCSLPGGHR